MDQASLDDGWRQIRAGVSLVAWSKLATFDSSSLAFIAADGAKFESAGGHPKVHKEFGRLICWITFSVGAEYLVKGVCLLRGSSLGSAANVVRFPSSWDENLQNWIQLVNSDHPSVKDKETSLGTLGAIKVDTVMNPGPERDLVSASIKLLASTIRNRDAHRYTQNVRAFHFPAVEKLFVPSLNALLQLLAQDELRSHLKSV